MPEKLDLQKFRELKNEVVSMLENAEGKDLTEEEEEALLTRYKEIIETLTAYDLSDIDFSEWNGMYLVSDEHAITLDFSRNKCKFRFWNNKF